MGQSLVGRSGLFRKTLVVREADWISFMHRDHIGSNKHGSVGWRFDTKPRRRSGELHICLTGIGCCLAILPLIKALQGDLGKVIRDSNPFLYLVGIGMRLDFGEQGV